MDTLTRWISNIFPKWAASRIIGRARLEQAKRYYEAVQVTASRPRRGNGASADAVNDRSRQHLREFARWLDENHDLAVGVLDDLVTNVVGEGAGIEPMALNSKDRSPAIDFNNQLHDLWLEFWSAPEVTGELPGAEVERLVCRTLLRDGELFIKHQSKQSTPFGSLVPYSMELLEADFCPYWMIDPSTRVVHGIQKDGWGRPVGYYIFKQHPGSPVFAPPTLETIYISAEDMMHLKLANRLHQTRGVSVFHSVLGRLDDLKDYEESERIAARIAASLTAFIRRDIAMSDNFTTTTNDDSTKNYKMEQGMIFDGLMPGEDIGLIDSKRPNPNLINFRDSQVRAIASGTGTRFSSISKNYSGTYSAQRQELIEAGSHYKRIFDYLRAKFYLPVWKHFVDAVRLAGLITIPRGIDIASLYRPEIRSPSIPWIDPLKEVSAYRLMVASGFRSRQQVIRDLGGDPATVDAQIETDDFIPKPTEVIGKASDYEKSPEDKKDDSTKDDEGSSTDDKEDGKMNDDAMAA